MADYLDILVFSLIGSLFSMIGGIILLSRKTTANIMAEYATPFAAGALLAAVFLDLLPEGVAESESKQVFVSALVGLLIFFYLERFLLWFHHHNHHLSDEKSASTSLIIIGDSVHNFLDGIVIASAFLISIPTGIITTIAVAAHEIPQEIGDFGLLLARGMNRKKILTINVISSLFTVVAALITFNLGSADKFPSGILLGLSAGFLLYIAASDIIPSIHKETGHRSLTDIRPLLLIVGVIVVALAIKIAEQFIVG